MVRFSATILPLSVAAIVSGATVSQKWSLTAENIAPDGFTRSAELVNGVFPGPLLTANKGDTVTVEVTNSLFDSTMRRSTSIVCNLNLCFVLLTKQFLALARNCALDICFRTTGHY